MVATVPAELDHRELERYVQRVADRWTLEAAFLGGARVEDLTGAPPQRERGTEFVAVFVSPFFDGVPWLERVYQAGALWDAEAMGGPIDVHCYTPVELERKRDAVRAVGNAVNNGLDLLAGRAGSLRPDRDHPLDRHARLGRDLRRDLHLA